MQDFIYWLIIAVAIGLFLYEKFFTKKQEKIFWMERFKQDVKKFSDLIYKKDYVTTRAEWEFFRRLQDFTKEKDVLIFTKVRVEDIIWVKSWKNGFRPYSITGRLDRSHFDFVAVQKSTLKLICVIELDDPTHASQTAQERDEVKNFICDFLKIPLIRFDKISPTDEDFREKGL